MARQDEHGPRVVDLNPLTELACHPRVLLIDDRFLVLGDLRGGFC